MPRSGGKIRASILSQIATIACLLKRAFGFILNASLRIRKLFASNDKKLYRELFLPSPIPFKKFLKFSSLFLTFLVKNLDLSHHKSAPYMSRDYKSYLHYINIYHISLLNLGLLLYFQSLHHQEQNHHYLK